MGTALALVYVDHVVVLTGLSVPFALVFPSSDFLIDLLLYLFGLVAMVSMMFWLPGFLFSLLFHGRSVRRSGADATTFLESVIGTFGF